MTAKHVPRDAHLRVERQQHRGLSPWSVGSWGLCHPSGAPQGPPPWARVPDPRNGPLGLTLPPAPAASRSFTVAARLCLPARRWIEPLPCWCTGRVQNLRLEVSYKGCIKPKPQPHMNLKRFPEAPGERGKAVGFAYTWGTDGQWSLQLWQKLWPRQLVQSKGRAQRKVGVQTAPCYLPQAGV